MQHAKRSRAMIGVPVLPFYNWEVIRVQSPQPPINALSANLLSCALAFLSPIDKLLCRRVNRLFRDAASRPEIWRRHVKSLWHQGVLCGRYGQLHLFQRWIMASCPLPKIRYVSTFYKSWVETQSRFSAWRLMVILACAHLAMEHETRPDPLQMTDVFGSCTFGVHPDRGIPTMYLKEVPVLGVERSRHVDGTLVLYKYGPPVEYLYDPEGDKWTKRALELYRWCLQDGQRGAWHTLPHVSEVERWDLEEARRVRAYAEENAAWLEAYDILDRALPDGTRQ